MKVFRKADATAEAVRYWPGDLNAFIMELYYTTERQKATLDDISVAVERDEDNILSLNVRVDITLNGTVFSLFVRPGDHVVFDYGVITSYSAITFKDVYV